MIPAGVYIWGILSLSSCRDKGDETEDTQIVDTSVDTDTDSTDTSETSETGETGETGDTEEVIVVQEVGEDGGTIEASNGVNTATLEIPAGALEEDVEITVETVEVEDLSAAIDEFADISGTAWVFTPHGTTFEQEIMVTLSQDGTADAVLRLDNEMDTTWEAVPDVSFQPNTLSFMTNTFSVYLPVAISENNNITRASNGVTIECFGAANGEIGFVDGILYTKRSRTELLNLIQNEDWTAVETTCTSGITDMNEMFMGSSFSGDISTWDVSSVTNMDYMFSEAASFNQDLSDWNVSSVVHMNSMFFGATAFDSDISGWNILNVAKMNSMFWGATSFNQDISGWDVSNVTNMYGMFSGATSFNQDISSWNMNSVTTTGAMFENATSFNQDISGWGVGSVTEMVFMFNGASSFDQDISGWDVSNVNNMDWMFNNATSFNQDLSDWCVSQISSEPVDFSTGASAWTEPQPLWGSCLINQDDDMDGFTANVDCDDNNASIYPGATDIPDNGIDEDCDGQDSLSGFTLAANNVTIECSGASNGGTGVVDGVTYTKRSKTELEALILNEDWAGVETTCTSDMTSMSALFRNSSFDGDISHWDTSSAVTMSEMFENASSFNQDLSHWDVSSVIAMDGMFSSASSFNQDLNTWNVSSVTNMEYLFAGASSFNGDISGWDVSSVTIMNNMFRNVDPFNGDISAWNVSNVTNMQAMFSGADVFNQDISGWDVSAVISTREMFSGAISFDQDLGSWDVSSVVDMDYMFNNATSFNQDLSDWCVTNIIAEPADFNNGASAWTEPQPVWGSCLINQDNDMDGFTANIDCDDNDATIYPGATEIANDGIDQDCDGSDLFSDDDGDGYFSDVDCDDSDPAVYPGAPEGCDFIDSDCNGLVDDNAYDGVIYYLDDDNDGYGLDNSTIIECAYLGSFPGYVVNSGDCDDSDGSIYPGASDISGNGIDEDCDGSDATTFALGANGVTIECGAANDGDIGIVDGVTYTKRTKTGLQALIANSDWTAVETTCTSGIADMSELFSNATSFNGDISAWDTSNVTDMRSMFNYATSFNGDLSFWNVSSVTTIEEMFNSTTIFNGDLSSWDVSSVTNMGHVFYAAPAFNGDISSWNTSAATDMGGMFQQATSFDQDISGWDTSNVTDMSYMFYQATIFNQDLNIWDVSSVTNMGHMFYNADSFNQDLSDWCVSQFSSEPSNFDTGASAWTLPMPVWGTCP